MVVVGKRNAWSAASPPRHGFPWRGGFTRAIRNRSWPTPSGCAARPAPGDPGPQGAARHRTARQGFHAVCAQRQILHRPGHQAGDRRYRALVIAAVLRAGGVAELRCLMIWWREPTVTSTLVCDAGEYIYLGQGPEAGRGRLLPRRLQACSAMAPGICWLSSRSLFRRWPASGSAPVGAVSRAP